MKNLVDRIRETMARAPSALSTTVTYDDLNKLCGALELYKKALEFYRDADNLCYEEKIQGEFHLFAHERIDSEAINCESEIQKLLGGVNEKPK